MKSLLCTGASGFFGKSLVRRLLEKDRGIDRICIYSRGEYAQYLMRQEFNDDERLRFFIGDVRDKDRLTRAMEGVDVVVAAAALKRIEVGYYCPDEMTKTNIDGALNTIYAAASAGVKKVVALSSDKAYAPVSAYGLSKAMAEALFLSSNNMYGLNGPKYSCVRYGNVWRSTGSIVPIWEKMIAEGKKSVPVTDPDCTRFFMLASEAVDLVLNTIDTMQGGELNIPDLPAYRVGDLAEAMGVKMDIIGLPEWEKKHESMSEVNTSDKARRMSVSEIREKLACL